MTACAIEVASGDGGIAGRGDFTIAADGSYAARLTESPGARALYPERWTLEGPEPYAVLLPGREPEAADSQVLPLADGRVLIARGADGAHRLALLYPTDPGTGELPLGIVESAHLTLLPPAPCGRLAYALTPGPGGRSTQVWLVAGSASGRPERVADVAGHCTGGAWLDREGRLLALDRTEDGGVTENGAEDGAGEGAGNGAAGGEAGADPAAGRCATKAVAVDLARGGEVTPFLQIAEDSNDRLLMADPDSGLLLVRSDAPGEDRIGWGVLGSERPIRFPEALHPEDVRLTPFAVQPRQMLLPESCSVALRAEGPNGTWLAVWHATRRELRHLAAPEGWLTGRGLWTPDGELRLPWSTAQSPCGLARMCVPEPAGQAAPTRSEAPKPPDSQETAEPPNAPNAPKAPERPKAREGAAASYARGRGARAGQAMQAARAARAERAARPKEDLTDWLKPRLQAGTRRTSQPAPAPAAPTPGPRDVTPVQQRGSPPADGAAELTADGSAARKPVPLQQAPLAP